MNAELEAYDRAWNETPKDARNAVCQALADEYVAAHPELAAKYGALSIPELVSLVDLARQMSDVEKRIELDVWIMAAFEFQRIGGYMDNTERRHPVSAINADGDRRQAGG